MHIEVINLQRRHRVNRDALRRLAAWLMTKTAAMNPGRNWLGCDVVLVGHARMIRLNRDALGHEGTTDVITFAYRSLPGEPRGWRGEIVINLDEARDAADRLHTGFAREAALYLAHGCQHLGGADDATPAQRAAMNRRQQRWLRQADAEGMLRDL